MIEIQGGDGPYTTSWTNGPNTIFYSNLKAGTYTVLIRDINDCRTTQSFTITEPEPLQVNVIKVTPQGCDLNTGAIDVEATGGTAPYTYNWIAYADTEDISGLNARNYQLEVTDYNGCKTNRITIAVPKECGCDNVDDGGTIGFDDNCENTTTVCIDANSTTIGSCSLPTGGSGTIEYLWLASTACPNVPPTSITNDPLWTIIPNSNTMTLTITNLSQTTCYIRCARRSGCDDYLEPVAEMLKDHCEVIRFELRGCGRSDYDGKYDLTTSVDDIEFIRKEYGFEKIMTGGHSAGVDFARKVDQPCKGVDASAVGGMTGNQYVWSRLWLFDNMLQVVRTATTHA